MPRIFIAIQIPLDVARTLLAAIPPDPGLRPVSPENVHITLAFIGTLDESRVPSVVAAAGEAVTGAAAFDIHFEALERFPPGGSPHAIVAGLGAAARAVIAIGERVRSALGRHEIPFDPKPLVPHVTLARVRDDADLRRSRAMALFLRRTAVAAGVRARADAVHVMESRLSPRGAEYSSRARVPLPDR